MLGTGVPCEEGPDYGVGRLLAPSTMLVCKHLIATPAMASLMRWYAVHRSHKRLNMVQHHAPPSSCCSAVLVRSAVLVPQVCLGLLSLSAQSSLLLCVSCMLKRSLDSVSNLLVGKPGCSKSLAMGVLQNNLNGKVSNKVSFTSMPAGEVLAFRRLPLATPYAILGAFHSVKQFNLVHNCTIVCVLIDEVGLAEGSPHLPMKVMHPNLGSLLR